MPSWHADRQLHLFTTALFTSKYPNLIVTHVRVSQSTITHLTLSPLHSANVKWVVKLLLLKIAVAHKVNHTNQDNYQFTIPPTVKKKKKLTTVTPQDDQL